MTKNLLIALLALGTLSFVPAAEARSKHKSSECAPECTTEVEKHIIYEPCEKWVKVQGTCPHEVCTKTTTCIDVSQKCVGECSASCSNQVSE